MPTAQQQAPQTHIDRPFMPHFLLACTLTSLLLIASIIIYLPTAESALRVWTQTETFKHCFFIIPIVLFLLWDKKHIFKEIPAIPFLPALILSPFIGIGWIISHIASINIGEHLMLVAFFQMIILTIFGYRLFWAFLFPFFFLWFLVPFGEFFVPLLQNITTWFSLLFLTLVNIPFYNDGVYITVPNGNFEVAEACAGLRFLIATMVLGFLFAYLFYKSTFRRFIFICLSLIIPIIANGIRAFGIIFIAYLTDNEYAVGVDHLVYGWFFFAFVLALLLGIGLLFREDTTKAETDNFELYAPKTVASPPSTTRKQFLIAGLLTLVLLVPARLYGIHMDKLSVTDTIHFSSLHLQTKPPLTETECKSPWPVLFEGASILSNCYQVDNQTIELKIAYYPHQTNDHSLLSYKNQFYDDIGTQWKKTLLASLVQDGNQIPLSLQTYYSHDIDQTIAVSYWINGAFTTSKIKVKLDQIISQVKYGHQTGFILMILLPDKLDDKATQALLEKIAEGLPDLNVFFTKIANPNTSEPLVETNQ